MLMARPAISPGAAAIMISIMNVTSFGMHPYTGSV
ncbi:hypothetical protein A2U01_0117960, partial [Trifolium medium]|nr:hypothetical protein [Trifolium medium]